MCVCVGVGVREGVWRSVCVLWCRVGELWCAFVVCVCVFG